MNLHVLDCKSIAITTDTRNVLNDWPGNLCFCAILSVHDFSGRKHLTKIITAKENRILCILVRVSYGLCIRIIALQDLVCLRIWPDL